MGIPAVVVAGAVTASEASDAAEAAGSELIAVVHDEVLVGITTRARAGGAEGGQPVLSIASADPPTVRPGATARQLVERIRSADVGWLAVTTASGRFLGTIDAAALVELARTDRLP